VEGLKFSRNVLSRFLHWPDQVKSVVIVAGRLVRHAARVSGSRAAPFPKIWGFVNQ